jgi:DNA modification methylase
MKKLLDDPEKYYKPKKRPSGHNISQNFGNNNGGAIPSNLIKIESQEEDPPNLLEISNTDNQSQYFRLCKAIDLIGHPARFPEKIPEFFIKFLTEPDDLVVDIFAGSNTTGHAAEALSRRWMAFEKEKKYLAASVFRFLEKEDFGIAGEIYDKLSEKEPSDWKVPQIPQLFDQT